MKKQLLLIALLWGLGLHAATDATPVAPQRTELAQQEGVYNCIETMTTLMPEQKLLMKKNSEQLAYTNLIKSLPQLHYANKSAMLKALTITLLQVATTHALRHLPVIGTRLRKFDSTQSTPFIHSNRSIFRNPRDAAATAGLIALNGAIWATYYAALSATLDKQFAPSYRQSLANFLDIWHTIPQKTYLHTSLLKVIEPLHAQLVAARTKKPHKTTVQLLPLTEQASKKLLCYIITAAHLKKNALAVEISVLLKKIDDYKKQQLEAEFEDEDNDDDDFDHDSPGETVAPKPSTQQAPHLDYDFDDDDDDYDDDDSNDDATVAPTPAKPSPQPTAPTTHAYDDDEDDLDEDE